MIAALKAAVAALMVPDGRRAWALVFLTWGGVMMTSYAAVALWLVRRNAFDVFALGVLAHLSIILVLTGIAGLLVKRTIEARDGDRTLKIGDQGAIDDTPSPATVSAAAAGAAAGAVAGASGQGAKT
jgi:hypothetical protein